MASIEQLQAGLDAVVTNVADQTVEIGRIVEEIKALKDSIVSGEDTDALLAKIDGIVAATQATEDSLKAVTTADPAPEPPVE